DLELAFCPTVRSLPLSGADGCQLLLNRRNIGNRAVVGLLRTFVADIGCRDDVNLMPQVIERQQTVEEHQGTIGKIEVIPGPFADVFQLADDVVRAEAYRSREERR